MSEELLISVVVHKDKNYYYCSVYKYYQYCCKVAVYSYIYFQYNIVNIQLYYHCTSAFVRCCSSSLAFSVSGATKARGQPTVCKSVPSMSGA